MPVKSRYQTIDLPTNGPSYESRAIPLSAQRSVNIYPESTPSGMSPTVMLRWPGITLKDGDVSGGEIIGTYVWKGVFYAVSDTTLRKYSDDLTTFEEVGEIDRGLAARASISDNGEVMLIVAGASAWEYDGATLSKVVSVNFKPTKVQFLNERFYLNGDDGGISVSDVLSTNFDAANVFYGRSTPEETITFHIFNQTIYLFDSNSIEPWQDVGVGNPPTQRINQGIIEDVGASSILGIETTDSYMYFIGSDGHAYRVNGFAAQDITNPVIASHFRGLNKANIVSDSITVKGQKFIIFNFVSDDERWVFSETSGQWFEIGGDWYRVAGMSFYKEEWVGGDLQQGNLWQVDPDSLLLPFCERIIATVSGDDIGQPGVMLEMSKIRFSLETGFGRINSSTYENPQVMIIPSFDGGYTYSRPIFLNLGENGDYVLPVELHMMQQFRRAVFKIRLTEFVGSFTIFSASIDARKAGY